MRYSERVITYNSLTAQFREEMDRGPSYKQDVCPDINFTTVTRGGLLCDEYSAIPGTMSNCQQAHHGVYRQLSENDEREESISAVKTPADPEEYFSHGMASNRWGFDHDTKLQPPPCQIRSSSELYQPKVVNMNLAQLLDEKGLETTTNNKQKPLKVQSMEKLSSGCMTRKNSKGCFQIPTFGKSEVSTTLMSSSGTNWRLLSSGKKSPSFSGRNGLLWPSPTASARSKNQVPLRILSSNSVSMKQSNQEYTDRVKSKPLVLKIQRIPLKDDSEVDWNTELQSVNVQGTQGSDVRTCATSPKKGLSYKEILLTTETEASIKPTTNEHGLQTMRGIIQSAAKSSPKSPVKDSFTNLLLSPTVSARKGVDRGTGYLRDIFTLVELNMALEQPIQLRSEQNPPNQFTRQTSNPQMTEGVVSSQRKVSAVRLRKSVSYLRSRSAANLKSELKGGTDSLPAVQDPDIQVEGEAFIKFPIKDRLAKENKAFKELWHAKVDTFKLAYPITDRSFHHGKQKYQLTKHEEAFNPPGPRLVRRYPIIMDKANVGELQDLAKMLQTDPSSQVHFLNKGQNTHSSFEKQGVTIITGGTHRTDVAKMLAENPLWSQHARTLEVHLSSLGAINKPNPVRNKISQLSKSQKAHSRTTPVKKEKSPLDLIVNHQKSISPGTAASGMLNITISGDGSKPVTPRFRSFVQSQSKHSDPREVSFAVPIVREKVSLLPPELAHYNLFKMGRTKSQVLHLKKNN